MTMLTWVTWLTMLTRLIRLTPHRLLTLLRQSETTLMEVVKRQAGLSFQNQHHPILDERYMQYDAKLDDLLSFVTCT